MISEIQKLKIALTSNCTLNCTHCNIDKNSNLNISYQNATKAIDLILNSNGKFKRLELYGGEPFLRFNLLKKIVEYAQKIAHKNKKNLSIHIATNGTVINEDILNWLKKTNVFIAVSFSGTKESHNLNRRFKNGSGSYEIVWSNIEKIFNSIGKKRFVCIYCVHPDFASRAFNDFKEIISTGIRIIDIECVHGAGWKDKNYNEFEKQFHLINEYILKLSKRNINIFHEAFIEYIRTKDLNTPACPGYMDMEVYPDGEIGFYPYAFIDYEKSKRIISIGNISKGIQKRYIKCKYLSPICKSCVANYYKIEGLSDGSIAYEIRNSMIKKLFKKIIKNPKLYKKYITELIELTKFFYEC